MNTFRSAFFLFLPVAALGSPACSEIESFDEALTIITNNCTYCHTTADPVGELDLERFGTFESLLNNLDVWVHALERIDSGEMPPRNGIPMSDDERDSLSAWLTETIQQAACGDGLDPGPTPLRRLNRLQYSATVRDLIGVQFDSGQSLPSEGAGGEGFDNAAETLFLSPVHAERFLEAARETLEYAARDAETRQRLIHTRPSEESTALEAAREILQPFVERAFRRPLAEGELDPYLGLVEQALSRDETYDNAILYAMQGVMISPHFLFIVEHPNPTATIQVVPQYEMANRLSYFLWSSMPDGELLGLAAQGKLQTESVLRQQIDRMLATPIFDSHRNRSFIRLEDRKFHEFMNSFVSQWLGTRELGRDIQPDRERYPFYDSILESAFQYEPIYVLQHIFTENRSLLDLIDADYTYVNRQLAYHYRIHKDVEVPNQQLQYVDLPEGSGRGGLITMAGPLTVTSFPHRTSPVLRGKWVLETVLGTSPPPPPPDVPELPEEGEAIVASTMRERLMLHRENPVCASCHDRIDPIGFGLENFDSLGLWREEDADQPIDASGILPDGTPFSGPDELKQILMDRKDQIMRNLTEKMLGYALGRSLIFEDRCTVDHIMEQLRKDNYRARTLLYEIVTSIPFRFHRGSES